MKISTRGRYAIRVMLDLAEHNTGEYIPLMDIAKRQEISEKYLEAIVASLSKNGFVRSLRGKGGGYQLLRAPEEYTVGSILRLTEGSLAPVACLDDHRISARERHPAKHCRCGKVSISCSMNILTELLWKTFWSRAQIQETM